MKTTVQARRRWNFSIRHPATLGAIGGMLLLFFVLCPPAEGALAVTSVALFNSVTNGSKPLAELVLGTNGLFYGTASAGGAAGAGTVFSITTAGALTNLASFYVTNGSTPRGALVQGPDGNFYGTTYAGGTNANGTVFRITPSGNVTTLVSFNGTNGAAPSGGLALGPDGNFYGTTSGGGSGGNGTVFVMSPAGNLTTLFSFNYTNGAVPLGSLVFGTNGFLYGTTTSGGANGFGTVYSISTNGVQTNLYVFQGGTDGLSPQAGLVQGSDGNLYGTTSGGGSSTNLSGTVFRIGLAGGSAGSGPPVPGGANGGFTPIYSFSGADGTQPSAQLLQAADGTLYGTTRFGGEHQNGALFGLTTSGTLTLLYSFTGGTDGSQPQAGVTVGTNFDFYGVCSAGSAAAKSSAGTVWRLSGLPPFIITQPTNQTVLIGSNVTFSVSAGGPAPLSYQWQFNTNNLGNRVNILGVNTPTLTLSNITAANAGSYRLIVKSPGGAVTSSVAVLTVNLRPVVTVQSPAQNALVTKPSITVSGTVNQGGTTPIGEVFYQFNGGGWQSATPQGGWAKWTAVVTPVLGTNTFQAYAANVARLNSLTNTVTFFYGNGTAPLVVQVDGQGTVSPNYAKPLQLWRFYTLTAKPATGNVFAGWTNSVEHSTTNSARLTFLMRSNLVLSAKFVPNPFSPVAGIYNGLFFDIFGGVVPESSGFFTVTLTTRGTFSGTILNSGARYPFTGQLDPITGAANANVVRKNLSPLSVSLQFNFTNGLNHVDGTVSDGLWTVALDGDRTVFNAKTNLAPQQGLYTLVIPGNTNSTASPGGASYGTIIVDKTGKLRLAASLADGTKVSQAVVLSQTGQWPFYASLYTGKGLILGWIEITNSPVPLPLSGNVAWFKAASDKDKYYPGGFTNLTAATGAAFKAPAAGQNVLSLVNGVLVLDRGNLSQPITNLFSLGAKNQVLDGSGHKLHLSITPSSGLFKGSLVNPQNSKPISFTGVVLQDQNVGYGFFLGTNLSSQVFFSPAP